MEKLLKLIGAIVLILPGIIALALFLAIPVYYLWNGCVVGLIPGVTPLTSIWHAWGLSVLCGLLFKSNFSSK